MRRSVAHDLTSYRVPGTEGSLAATTEDCAGQQAIAAEGPLRGPPLNRSVGRTLVLGVFASSRGLQSMKPSLNLPRKPVVVAICLAVGALHLFTGPHYHGPFRSFVTGYLIDLVLPFSLVLLLGVGLDRSPALRHPIVRATAVFLLGTAVEILQYVGIPLFGRTFDPVDILMYATGAIAALAFECQAFPRHPK